MQDNMDRFFDNIDKMRREYSDGLMNDIETIVNIKNNCTAYIQTEKEKFDIRKDQL